jgi:putative DNA primase/helicase
MSRPNLRAVPDADTKSAPAAPPTAIPGPDDPREAARWLIQERFGGLESPHLRTWRGNLYEWVGSHWRRMDEPRFASIVSDAVGGRFYRKDSGKLAPWKPTSPRVKGVRWGVSALVNVDDARTWPCWLTDAPDGLVIPCANGLLRADTRKLVDPSPNFFNGFALPFDYDQTKTKPTRWLKFLAETWPDDPKAIDLLGEWFGYVLSGRLDLHKGLLLIGPKRSGKGTITRILRSLVGAENCAAPMLHTLHHSTGLEDLRDKALALVPEARLENSKPAVVQLLAVIGQDPVSVNVKAEKRRTLDIPARFILTSNEVPSLSDASATVASRFLILRTTISHFGSEDATLERALQNELAGILNWSLDGLDRLNAQGAFSESAAAPEVETEMQELSSPVKHFVDSCLILDPDAIASRADLFEAWRFYAKEAGQPVGTLEKFGRDLKAYVPDIRDVRPRAGSDANRPRAYRGVKIRGNG